MGASFEKEYPRSWRCGDLSANAEDSWSTQMLRVSCRCSAVRIELQVSFETSFRNCHCAKCRRYACAAFATYLTLPRDRLLQFTTRDELKSFIHSCDHELDVVRYACATCRSKIATIPEIGDTVLLAAGSIVAMPRHFALRMRSVRAEHRTCLERGAPWFVTNYAVASKSVTGSSATGSCACAECVFAVNNLIPTELQHCYCSLCQRYSGSAFQTWVPCDGVLWHKSSHLQLIRTTRHAQRHQCAQCAAVLSIVYDSQPHTIWIAAGAIQDECMPDGTDTTAFYRKIHICCETMPCWYMLPNDDLPRLKYAS